MGLHNKRNRKELKQAIQQEREARQTISFYKYHQIEDPTLFRNDLYRRWEQLGVMGRVYVATEGINAQICVREDQVDDFRKDLYQIPFLYGVRLNIAVEEPEKAFFKLAIKVRPKIVADGLDDNSFDASQGGIHLNAETFNELAEREDSVLIDMRNHYETEVGHFVGAICPDVDTFRDSLPIVEEILQEHKDKNILMYCTGGIRCEKASAWFKHKGYEKVYQLEGGIIKYAHDVEEKGLPNKFRGKNFVFDERLGERITDDIIAHCHQCGVSCDSHTNCKNVMCNHLFIQCESCAATYDGCCSEECQEIIHLPEEVQLQMRKGTDSGVRIYTKGRKK
ncbi:MAG: rhodanese-related sulfurtransferase [Bacteroidota bacterium]